MRYPTYIITIVSFILSINAKSQNTGFTDTNKITMDYLNVPGPLTFENLTFNLVWSSHPTTALYIQEYIQDKELAAHYTRMLLIQLIVDTQKIENLLSVQLSILEKRKQTDKLTNYQVFNNPDKTEYVLDFVLSKGQEELNTVEWNAYRYQYFWDENGRKGIILFGVSFRNYDTITSFLSSLPQLRKNELSALIHYPTPKIKLL